MKFQAKGIHQDLTKLLKKSGRREKGVGYRKREGGKKEKVLREKKEKWDKEKTF